MGHELLTACWPVADYEICFKGKIVITYLRAALVRRRENVWQVAWTKTLYHTALPEYREAWIKQIYALVFTLFFVCVPVCAHVIYVCRCDYAHIYIYMNVYVKAGGRLKWRVFLNHSPRVMLWTRNSLIPPGCFTNKLQRFACHHPLVLCSTLYADVGNPHSGHHSDPSSLNSQSGSLARGCHSPLYIPKGQRSA